jgi:hypothetical protein
MKFKYIIFLVLFSTNLLAQKRDNIKQRIESQRIAFITDRLSLSPEEAQKFWPVYNKFTNEIEIIKRDINKSRKISNEDLESMSDKDSEKYLEQMLNQQQKLIELQRKYHSELKSSIPVQKIALLYKAEYDFKRVLIKRLRSSGMQAPSDDDE